VLNIPVHITASENGPAHGAALFGAVAAGKKNGGYDTVLEAANAMKQPFAITYMPIKEHVRIYERLYQEYIRLYELFGSNQNSVMKRLLFLRQEVSKNKKNR
jgi:L-ribulokinase